MLARMPRRAVLPALGVVGLLIVVMAPLTFGAGGLLGGGSQGVEPASGTGAPICLLGCAVAQPVAVSASAPAAPAPVPARGSAVAVSRPRATTPTSAASPAQGAATPAAGGPTNQPVQQPVDQVTGGLPIVPTLPLGLPPVVPPGAPS